MKTVALILARGGSKRVPRKNLQPINDKPLLAYGVEAALNCKEIAEVWVSTDCKEIAKTAEHYGAKVHMRPDELASDTATSESALLEFEKSKATSFDILCFMQPTSPLTQSSHLSQGIELVANGKCDSALSVSEDVRFYWNAHRKPINYDPLNRPRSQELKGKTYRESGAFYISTREALLKSGCRISGKVEFVVVPEGYSWEIDTWEDFKIVETILKSGAFSSFLGA